MTEPQEREILLRCRADFDRRKIDLSMYATPALADDVADLVKAMQLTKVNLYGISYGTRWALEIMRRHPGIVRSAVLDGVYPPQINGEHNAGGPTLRKVTQSAKVRLTRTKPLARSDTNKRRCPRRTPNSSAEPSRRSASPGTRRA